jgi:hypothetical protein
MTERFWSDQLKMKLKSKVRLDKKNLNAANEVRPEVASQINSVRSGNWQKKGMEKQQTD